MDKIRRRGMRIVLPLVMLLAMIFGGLGSGVASANTGNTYWSNGGWCQESVEPWFNRALLTCGGYPYMLHGKEWVTCKTYWGYWAYRESPWISQGWVTAATCPFGYQLQSHGYYVY